MFRHVLVPLDGSKFAECVLPHAIAFAASAGVRMTLVHVLEPPTLAGGAEPTDPVRWQLATNEMEAYLAGLARSLEGHSVSVAWQLFEGNPTTHLVDFAMAEGVDLLALSSHGRSGLFERNLGATAHELILCTGVSVLLARARQAPPAPDGQIRYERVLLPLDGSRRAESVLQTAHRVASEHGAQLLLAHVIERPNLPSRLPLPPDEVDLVERFVALRGEHGRRYLTTLVDELGGPASLVETRLEIAPDPVATLHDLSTATGSDLVVMSAHGTSGSARWPFGSTVLNLLTYGTKTLLVIQDLPQHEQRPQSEPSTRQPRDHE